MKHQYSIPLNRADEMLRLASRVFIVLKFTGLICAICFASAAFAQVRYQITRIPTTQGATSAALGINNKGEVVGYSFQGEDYQAFLYSSSDQSLTEIGSLGGKINAACAINDGGQVIGYSQDANGNLLAFVYSRHQPIAALGTLEGAATSEAFGINSSGAAVGDSQSGNQNHRPVRFSNGSVQDLGLGSSNDPDALETAYAINDAGQIAGRHSAANNAFHAFVLVNGNTTDLGTLGGANGEALAINKNGQVVGDSDTSEGPPHAFVFDRSELKDLGTLPGFDNASYARGINNSGDIVGESDSADQKRAFLYTKSRMVELDKLAENFSQSGFNSLDVAYGINDQGRIVGYGTTSANQTAAFVAIPLRPGNQGQAGGPPQDQRQAGPPPPQSQLAGEVVPGSESNEASYDVFYTNLSSEEGNWVEAGDYGYCFRPRVSEDWRPYRDGHWVWTDRGWYWDSNEKFAWATYHYGRWVNIRGIGWCWVPGNQWAPAWVSWRESDEQVGWAPLPPEADVSGNRSISSWSDSYYGIGPAAYAFISYSHWREPNYARYIEPPERNVQIINETKNVTNIVTNNNVINNFGPPVQTVAAKTNQNIQQVDLALNPATRPNAHYGQTLQGNHLSVVTPLASLKPQATHPPVVQKQIENVQVEKGWQGVKPQDAERLKKTIAEQNPAPKDLPKPMLFVNPQGGQKAQVSGPPGATGSPSAVAGQRTPPNLMKPAARSPNANVTPGATPNVTGQGKKLIPPNLIGAKSSEMPIGSPTGRPAGTPVGSRPEPGTKPTTPGSPIFKQSPSGNAPGASTPALKEIPPNLNAPSPPATPSRPASQEGQPTGILTPKPAVNPPPGQNAPHAPPTPHSAATPIEEKKPAPPPPPTPHPGPAILTTPKPTPEAKPARQEISAPNPPPVSAPHREPVAAPKPAAEARATPPPKQEIKTPPPRVEHAPAPPAQLSHTPAAEPEAPKATPPQQTQHPGDSQKHEPGKAKPTPTP